MRKRKKKLLSVIKARETALRFSRLKLPPPDHVLEKLREFDGIPSKDIHDEINDLSKKIKEMKGV